MGTMEVDLEVGKFGGIPEWGDCGAISDIEGRVVAGDALLGLPGPFGGGGS